MAFKIPLCYYSFAGREKYPRGRRGGFAKALGRATGAGVRIPPSPPKRVKKSRKPYFRDFFIFTKPDLKQKCNKSCKGTPFYSEIRSHICTPILCRLFLVMNASRLPSLLPSGIINDLKPMCKPPCPSPHQRYVLHPIGIPLTEKY